MTVSRIPEPEDALVRSRLCVQERGRLLRHHGLGTIDEVVDQLLVRHEREDPEDEQETRRDREEEGVGNRLGRRRDAVGTRLPRGPTEDEPGLGDDVHGPVLPDGEGNETRRFLPDAERERSEHAACDLDRSDLVRPRERAGAPLLRDRHHRPRVHAARHAKDDAPIGYRKVCKKDDKAVPDDEIVKGYEIAKGKYVHVTDEDFAAAEVGRGTAPSAIEEFVPYQDIDPIFFERTYYLGPEKGAEKRVRAATPGDGGVGSRRRRAVRHAEPRASRLPARARGRDHAREDVLRGRDPADRRD